MNQLLTINNVRGYIDRHGVAQLNLEDVARGLGFVDNSKDVEYVKWDRVKQYLNDFKFSTEVSKETFIPENIFYRLAIKAKNEVAEKFQIIVFDEILPAIRKTGSYSIVKPKELSKMDILEMAMESEKKVLELNTVVELMTPKAEFHDAVIQSDQEFTMQQVAGILANKAMGRNNLFKFLVAKGVLIDTYTPYHKLWLLKKE